MQRSGGEQHPQHKESWRGSNNIHEMRREEERGRKVALLST